MDPRLQEMAEVLVRYSIGVKAGDWVTIMAPSAGEPLAVACTRAVLAAGGRPWPLLSSEDARELILRLGTPDQVSFIPPPLRLMMEQTDATIYIQAPTNTKSVATVDPNRIGLESKAFGPLLEMSMKRTAEGTFRWTIAQQPTAASAQDAGMSLLEYADFVFRAGLLDHDDPVAQWRALGERQDRVREWLAPRSEVHVVAPGTDFRVGVEGRTWMSDDGHLNFPGGEVFTGPLEDSAEGEVAFTFPGFYEGKEVPGIRLRFEAGRVVDASADANEEFLHEMLDMDAGSRRLGEFAFGLNQGIQAFTKNTLFDEKIGGTMHLALGASYPETGGTNQSDLHWDIVCDLRRDATVTVDGREFSRNGALLVS